MAEGDLLELERTSEGCHYDEDSTPTTYPTLTRFLNDHSGMNYIYIFSAQTGWQYINLNE